MGLVIGLLLAATFAAAQRGPSVAAAPAPVLAATKTESFNWKVKCAEVGMQWADALKKNADRSGSGQSAAQPRFAYNAELDTCIMRAGILDVKTGKLYLFLADALTEETLLDLSDNDPVKQTAFNKAETRLMGPPESDKLAVK